MSCQSSDRRRDERRVSKPDASDRWSSSAWESSPSRGRKTLTLNLRCLAAYPVTGKASGVNPEENSGVGAPKAVGRCTDFLPAAPAAKLVPNVSLCVPSDYIGEAERGILTTGQPRISINFAQAHALERSLQCRCPQRQEEHGRKTAIIDRELNIDIAALQETRLPLSGSLKEQKHTFFWQSKKREEPRLHGVGFALRNSPLSCVEPPHSGTARILALRLSTSSGPVNLLGIYAPTLCSSAETKDQFYEELETTIGDTPATEQLYLLGDFNARVGSDHDSWPRCIGYFDIGKLNENGQRLLELCCYHNLCITNTFFSTKPHHRTSWRHPRSRHWHQLDFIITRRLSLSCVLSTQGPASHQHCQNSNPRHNLCDRFANSIEDALKDCLAGNAEESNIRGMYDGVKKAFSPCINKIAPLKPASGNMITDQSKQVERWAEHYQELCSRENIVADTAAESTANLPVMEELDIPPSEEELGKVIDSLACGKAPGKDGIPPEVIKAGKKDRATPPAPVLPQCREEGAVLQEMLDANIITLYKNKDDRSDCNNYRAISLLCPCSPEQTAVTC
ncbi:uncharacterized protein LOC143300280 [Babylonia areolata]|uniref:uncharacterized protein LOC143300280 n=1 Tax=Babylonia areolata TaxID=304850 RepID=UPI003FCF9778